MSNSGKAPGSARLYRLAYTGIASGLFLALFPPFWMYSQITGRYRRGMAERLGRYPEFLRRRKNGATRIWIHAASVGEASVALSIARALEGRLPGCQWIFSTITEHGRRWAEHRLKETPFKSRTTCVFAPIDLALTARRALTALDPDVLACVETELWPNWIMEASRMGIKTALVNGRISVRSIDRYLKIRPLMQILLARMDAFSMIHESDARRIALMGAPRNRIEIHGNAKFDIPVENTAVVNQGANRALFGVTDETPVFIAGSIRGEEDAMVLSAYAQIVRHVPDTVMILAPRHMERVPQIVRRTREWGFSCQLRSTLGADASRRRAQVVILDTIGELHAVYGIADVVFCGGSLVPTGGQNVLEAAVWGKPVLYGPSMEDFQEAKEILDQTGGGLQVNDTDALAKEVLDLLQHPDRARDMGQKARRALAMNRGAAERHADVLFRLLTGAIPASPAF